MRGSIFLMVIFAVASTVGSTKIGMRSYLDMHDEGFVQNIWFPAVNYVGGDNNQFWIYLRHSYRKVGCVFPMVVVHLERESGQITSTMTHRTCSNYHLWFEQNQKVFQKIHQRNWYQKEKILWKIVTLQCQKIIAWKHFLMLHSFGTKKMQSQECYKMKPYNNQKRVQYYFFLKVIAPIEGGVTSMGRRIVLIGRTIWRWWRSALAGIHWSSETIIVLWSVRNKSQVHFYPKTKTRLKIWPSRNKTCSWSVDNKCSCLFWSAWNKRHFAFSSARSRIKRINSGGGGGKS